MSKLLPSLALGALLLGCSAASPEAPDVQERVRTALDSRGLEDVSIRHDRDTGVVTLSGKVSSDAEKAVAASAARSVAPDQVIANEVIVTPPGMEGDAMKIHDAVDEGIASNMKAMLVRMGSPADVSYTVSAAVVTLTGTVASQTQRSEVAQAAAEVANVEQVVNQLQVNQKATSPGRGQRPE